MLANVWNMSAFCDKFEYIFSFLHFANKRWCFEQTFLVKLFIFVLAFSVKHFISTSEHLGRAVFLWTKITRGYIYKSQECLKLRILNDYSHEILYTSPFSTSRTGIIPGIAITIIARNDLNTYIQLYQEGQQLNFAKLSSNS
jgi:hypothetical protein